MFWPKPALAGFEATILMLNRVSDRKGVDLLVKGLPPHWSASGRRTQDLNGHVHVGLIPELRGARDEVSLMLLSGARVLYLDLNGLH